MTLTDLHADPQKLAEFMGWKYEETSIELRAYGSWKRTTHVTSADDNVKEKWRAYVAAIQAGHPSAYKQQTRTQFIQECLREVGAKQGTVKARIQYAMDLRPDLYERAA